MFAIVGLIMWVIIPFIKGWRGDTAPPHPQLDLENTIVREPQEDTTITVGDMVMHDMMNQNDTYDIGVIDFGD